jgi:alkylation response protein AidB-like acyl-CoA dehydrogenase
MSPDCPVFALAEEQEALREAVRALADDKIAPRAAEVDRTSEFPWDVYEALVKSDLHAIHIPVAYGGAGATRSRWRSSSRRSRGRARPRR